MNERKKRRKRSCTVCMISTTQTTQCLRHVKIYCALVLKALFPFSFQSDLNHHDYAYTIFHRRCRCVVIMQNKPQFSLNVLLLLIADWANTRSHQQQITSMRIITICFLLFFFLFRFLKQKLHCSVYHSVIQLWNFVAKTSILNIHSLEVKITTEFVYWVCRKRVGLVL